MRVSVLILVFITGISLVPLRAQDKAAEGEYVLQATSADSSTIVKTATRWVLYSNGTGYHLDSEIQGQPSGLRIVQTEELDLRLVPAAIGYQLYRNDEKKPAITVDCPISGGVITCGGQFKQKNVPSSAPYKQNGPFWLWMEGLFALDMPWLFDGTVNMADLRGGTIEIPTISVLGGTAVLIGDAVSVAQLKEAPGVKEQLTVIAPQKPTQWEIYSDEHSTLQLAGTESIDIGGIKVATRHYIYGSSSPMGFWVTESGLLVKMSGFADGNGVFLLANYKQYKNFISELPVVHLTN